MSNDITPEHRSTDDRRQRRKFRFVDRRSGFDRRRDYPVLGVVRDNDWIVLGILVLLNLLSLFDGLLTSAELAFGIASEGNPVLGALHQASPWAAIAVKVGAILVVSVIIWRARRVRIILGLSLVSLAVFSALIAYHLGSLNGLGWI